MQQYAPRRDESVSTGEVVQMGDEDLGQSNAELCAALSAANSGSHVVGAGETLSSIAAEYTGSASQWRELWKANPQLSNPDRVSVGTTLVLPTSWIPKCVDEGATSSDTSPAQTQPAETQPAQTQPAQTQPEKTQTEQTPTQQTPATETQPKTAGESVVIQSGALTAMGEGSDAQTKYIHWPHTATSGVTLGKGYDIGSRSAATVISQLTAAGMSTSQATAISRGAGLKGDAAGTFVTKNRDSVGEIAKSVQTSLLATMLESYQEKAKNTATSTTADRNNFNAAGREKKEGKEAGTYVMSQIEWKNLHPAMVELLTDLIYQGGAYGYDRVAQINKRLKQHDGDHLAQFKAVRELFVGADGGDSYMDKYGAAIGEGREKGNASVTFGDATVDYKGRFRRTAIRLAYLNHVIKALESGKDVVMEKGGEQVHAPETQTTPGAGGSSIDKPPAVGGGATHVVQRGESLGVLANKFGVSIEALKQANASLLKKWGSVEGFEAGATITIPGSGKAEPTPTPTPEPDSGKTEPEVTGPEKTEPEKAEPEKAEPDTTQYVPDEIQGSVGASGVNKARDVRIVQRALIHLGWLDEGPEVSAASQAADEEVIKSLSATIEAIRNYQKFGLGSGGDGRVDVGGGTWTNMKARLGMIQDLANHEIAAEPIAPVLTSSQWISQFASDASKNGAGRGLREDEKAYAGKRNAVCCWDAAFAMTKQGSGKVSHLTSSRLPTLFQNGAKERVLGKQAELGVKYIDQQLLAGKPVMIGVDDGRTEVYNADQTTEHFIVIVGKVVNGGKISYQFFDPGTSWGSKGYSPDNLMEVGEDGASMSGDSYSGSKTYRLAQVRQNA
ncbi:MAG: LysM peptidoglycan-binding domain-containing protein [Alphaproteobacteria bacterium]|nr:LysM peptidoglycan-binding domain-containing protein [Alphaproteobacteria bacterium]